MKRNRIVVTASSLVIALVAAACGRNEPTPRDAVPPPAPPVTDEDHPIGPTVPSRVTEIASVASPTFGIERLRSMAPALSEDELRIAANALTSAMRHQETTSPEGQSLQARLREKLDVVLDAMKAKKIDVSEYESEPGAEIR